MLATHSQSQQNFIVKQNAQRFVRMIYDCCDWLNVWRLDSIHSKNELLMDYWCSRLCCCLISLPIDESNELKKNQVWDMRMIYFIFSLSTSKWWRETVKNCLFHHHHKTNNNKKLSISIEFDSDSLSLTLFSVLNFLHDWFCVVIVVRVCEMYVIDATAFKACKRWEKTMWLLPSPLLIDVCCICCTKII